MPAVWVSRSRIVIARRAGTIARPVSPGTATVVCAYAGMNRETGSESAIAPSSTSIMIATLVTAFDWDAMRKIASMDIGRRASRSAMPTAVTYATCPCRATSTTAPARLPSSTWRCR
jgi:hypothetical protein